VTKIETQICHAAPLLCKRGRDFNRAKRAKVSSGGGRMKSLLISFVGVGAPDFNQLRQASDCNITQLIRDGK
jgi:hypothetical protein